MLAVLTILGFHRFFCVL